MRTLVCSLLALLLAAVTALAAPAPFRKPAPEPDSEAVLAQLKQHLLREHGAHADRISPGGDPNEWVVIGNTPVLTGDNGRLMYEQRLYRVTARSIDRRGNVSFAVAVENNSLRHAITR